MTAGATGGGTRRQFIIEIAANTEQVVRGLRTVGAQLSSLTSSVNTFDTKVGALGQIVARTGDTFRRVGADANDLAMSYLSMGRNAVAFMEASVLLNRAGAKGSETFKRMAVDAWQFGHVMGIATQDSAKFMADLVGKFRLGEEAVRKLAGTAAALKQQFGASTEAVTGAMRVMPAYVKELKLGQQNLAGMAAGLERLGLGSSDASQMVGDMVRRLGDPKTRWQLNAMGIDSARFAKSLQKDGVGAVKELAKAAKGLPPVFLAEKFGWSQEQISALQNANVRMTDMMDAMTIANTSYKDNTSLTKLFGEATANLADQMKMLWEELKAVGMRVGMFLMPIVQVFVGALRMVIKLISFIPTPILGMISVFTVIGGFLAAAIFLIWRLVSRMSSLASSFIRAARSATEFTSAISRGRGPKSDLLRSVQYLDIAVSRMARSTYGVTGALKYYVVMQGLAVVSTLRHTLAELRRIPVLMASAKATWLINTADKALILVEAFLISVKNRGIVATLTETALYAKLFIMKSLDVDWSLKQIAVALWHLGVTKTLTAAQRALTAAFITTPYGWVVLAIAATAGAMYGLYKMAHSADAGIRTLGKTLLFVLALVQPQIYGILALFTLFGDQIKLSWQLAKAFFGGLLEGIRVVTDPIVEVGKGLVRSFSVLSGFINRLFGGILGDTKGLIGLMSTLGKVVAYTFYAYFYPSIKIAQFLIKALGFGLAVLVDLFREIFKPIADVMGPVIGQLRDGWEYLQAFFGLFGSSGKSSVSTWLAVGKAIQWVLWVALFPLVVMAKVFSVTLLALSKIFNVITATVYNLGIIFDELYGSFDKAKATFLAPLTTIYVLFDSINKILSGARQKANALWDSIASGAKKAADALKELAEPFGILRFVVGKLRGAMHGSGFLHIPEGAMGTIGPLNTMAKSFHKVASSVHSSKAALAGMSAAVVDATTRAKSLGETLQSIDGAKVGIASEVRHAIGGTIPVSTDASRARAGAVVSPVRMAGAGAHAPTPVVGGKSSKDIVVNLNMDGQRIASEIARINADELTRHHNGPMSPMRGVPL